MYEFVGRTGFQGTLPSRVLPLVDPALRVFPRGIFVSWGEKGGIYKRVVYDEGSPNHCGFRQEETREVSLHWPFCWTGVKESS